MKSEFAPVPPRNQSYDLLRIAAICAVVAVHTFGPTAQQGAASGFESWAARVLSIGSIWSVPVFVMLSGALTLGDHAHRDGPGRFYSRRAKRIIPAVLFWTIAYLIIRVFLVAEPMSWWAILTALVDTSVYPHLYFLWVIVGLYLIAPVLHAFLLGGGVRRAVVFAASALLLTIVVFTIPGIFARGGFDLPMHLTVLTYWLAYVGYFLTGYALSKIKVARPWLVVAAISIFALGTLTIVQSAFPDHLQLLSAASPISYLAIVVAVLSISMFVVGGDLLGRIPLGPRLSRLVVTVSEASFGVYLVHLAVLLVPYTLLPGFHEQRSLPEAVLAYLFIIVVSFAISIGARKVPILRTVF